MSLTGAEIMSAIAIVRKYGPVIVGAYRTIQELVEAIKNQDGITDEQRHELLNILHRDPRSIGMEGMAGVGDVLKPEVPPREDPADSLYGKVLMTRPGAPPLHPGDRVYGRQNGGILEYFAIPRGIGFPLPPGFELLETIGG